MADRPEPSSARQVTDDEEIRVLICGSRTWRDAFPIRAVLRQYADVGQTVVINGAAKWADSLADFYARSMSLEVEAYPADWSQYGKRAGYVRNSQMLTEGKPDVVWAFVDKPLAESRGTKMMVDIARKGGVPCYVVEAISPPTPDERNNS